jgi:tripartite-type tricarboxylate transporter receptor subunit TctC
MPTCRLCVIVAVLLGVCTPSSAESWPTKPVRVIVPYSPGSASDIIPRTIFARVEKELGQPIIVENRPGAGSIIGTAAVARADPDGYTFLSTASAFTTVPLTVANLSYDPRLDFAAVIPLANMTNVLVVSPDSGVKTLAEFVAYARAHRGSMNYVTIGAGSAAHLNAERFRVAAGFEAEPIPYKGSPEGLTDVMTGRVQFYFSPLLPALPLIRGGNLLALAVSSAQRDPQLPDVPTTIEAGYRNSEYNFWFGMFAPAKTPPAIIARLHGAISEALQDPDIRDRLAKLGVQPMPMTPSEFGAYVVNELEQNKELVRAGGLKLK